MLIPFDQMKYNTVSEQIVQILKNKTQSDIKDFFRVSVAFHLTRMASMMHTKVATKDRGTIPVNGYMINLASSGLGKGNSTNIIEEQLTNGFREEFTDSTFINIADKNLAKLAMKRYNISTDPDKSPDDELEIVKKEFEDLGDLPFDYDSGTSPAFKQVRHKCLMARAGALNFFVDEIGTNLLANSDLLGSYLESYDVGKIKQKLIKNTAENKRLKEINGKVPSNMLLFGTPDKLLDGAKTEEEFISMLETGYARRCLFGYSKSKISEVELTPEQVYDIATSNTDMTDINKLDKLFTNLAKEDNFNIIITMDKDVNLLLIEYRQLCEKEANKLPNHKHIEKAELIHRYFKALKLAGTYAFIDSSAKVKESHLYAAIKLAEDSGEAFKRILTREKPHVKLANFIGSYESDLTKSDLIEELPCYKGNESQKRELMSLAIAHGFRNNIIIKEKNIDGIDFYSGDMLKKTSLNELILSYSGDITQNFKNETIKFKDITKLTNAKDLHFVVHHLQDGYRDNKHIIPGFNILALDVDDGNTSIDMVNLLLGKYEYLLYTTKRHTDSKPRFRILFPMSHILKLSRDDYKDFMENVYNWLPINVDEAASDIARKWMTNPGKFVYNQGELLDVLPFIPKTKEADKRKIIFNDTQSLSNLERWFITRTGSGNRSNNLIKYAYALVDAGKTHNEIQDRVLALNTKLNPRLDTNEIYSTIMVSVANKLQEKNK